jgi:oligopeptide/dipeptide ABC transporter ATP-binding protein
VSSNPSPPLLEVENLVTRYPIPRGLLGTMTFKPQLHVHAADGISFSLRAGEMLALVGESGCGKTTTAQTIMRMVDRDAGTIRFRGRDITKLSHREMRPLRREMQLIYQDPYESLDPRFRVRDTVEEPLVIHGEGGSARDRERLIREALERSGLSPAELYIDRYPHELSGGQRQRVAIAASLVLNPSLLVADEPVSMLDVSVRAGILDLLADLRRAGLGILMITHDLSTAAHYADRIAVMYLGRIVEIGSAKEVVRWPQHPYTRALVSVVPSRDPRTGSRPEVLKGETPNAVHIPEGCRFSPRCPLALSECKSIDPQLRAVGDDGHEAACILVGGDKRLEHHAGEPPARKSATAI